MAQHRLYEYWLSNGSDFDLLVCEDDKEAARLSDLCAFRGVEHLVFPDVRAAFGDDLRPFKEELHRLFGALACYYEASTPPLVISPLRTLLFDLPKAPLFDSQTLSFGDTIDLNAFKQRMLHWGYSFVDIVELEGEISFRGDIIDLFVPNTDHPVRISLFDDEIEEIKPFEVETQRTLGEEVDSVCIRNAYYAFDASQYAAVRDAIEADIGDAISRDIASQGLWYLGELAEPFAQGRRVRAARPLDALLNEVYALNNPRHPREMFAFEPLPEGENVRELSAPDIRTLLEVHKRKSVTIIATNEAQLKQAQLFDVNELRNVNVVYAPYIVNLISEEEMIVSLNKETKKRRRRKTSILLDDLKPGGYVVHEEYGVGVFEAIEQAQILGGVKDFIVIRYQGDDKVLLPVENLDYIDRYIASSGSLPVIDRLGKGSFGKLKEKVRVRLFEIAAEIVNTAAARALIPAPKIEADATQVRAFQSRAGFEYTPDQAESIDEILRDLASGQIMDRLLSGDVGFGKTEVAMNAIYATAKAGYQAAMVVPTTLLNSQHFHALEARFVDTGIGIAKLDRFVTPKQKKEVLSALADGTVQVVVGTHALFGTTFNKLGLVIIDEEHKFGVKQKEKLKQMYEKVHLLSMSATPIPRSLNQALSSIKTMSQLLTPPSERQGVRTFVKAYDEKMIKEVILRERRRGGQIFYVYNSIDHMPIKLGELKALLPELRILVLHSKVSAVETETELLRFQEGAYDLMLATSIIESGIHMPRVNTMIIDGADRFGIADLHQLRGRVGRGSIEGFAYFIVEDKETLTDEAKKRLVALESNSFLGSGSVLAYHDLEIRGGGNLVGDAQSGHIKNIGYSLYLRMLEEAIRELSSHKQSQKAKVDIKLSISAFISDEVVGEDRLRLELYRRLSQCAEPSEVYEIEEETIDRFGRLDAPTKQFFELMVIKLLALEKNVKMLGNYQQNVTFEYLNGSKETIKSESRDDDDIIKAALQYLRGAKPKQL